jgi:hypothetical protein
VNYHLRIRMNLLQSFTANVTATISATLTVAAQAVFGRLARRGDGERGDVPGWVLITLMTAGLVTILWTLAGAKLGALFTSSMNSVTGPGAP